MQHTLTAVGQDAFGLFAFHAVSTGPRSAHCHDQAHLAGFQRTRNQILQNLDELMLRHLRVDVDAKTPVEILLGGQHLPQATFVLLDRFGLVGKGNLGIDHQREIHDDKLTQDPGESGIRQVLQANPGIEQATDLQVVILLVLDIHIRGLASRALVPE